MPSEPKIKQNLRAVENAIAQQRLEGLEVPPDIVAEMQRAARGEIEIEAGIRDTIRKFSSRSQAELGNGPFPAQLSLATIFVPKYNLGTS